MVYHEYMVETIVNVSTLRGDLLEKVFTFMDVLEELKSKIAFLPKQPVLPSNPQLSLYLVLI